MERKDLWVASRCGCAYCNREGDMSVTHIKMSILYDKIRRLIRIADRNHDIFMMMLHADTKYINTMHEVDISLIKKEYLRELAASDARIAAFRS